MRLRNRPRGDSRPGAGGLRRTIVSSRTSPLFGSVVWWSSAGRACEAWVSPGRPGRATGRSARLCPRSALPSSSPALVRGPSKTQSVAVPIMIGDEPRPRRRQPVSLGAHQPPEATMPPCGRRPWSAARMTARVPSVPELESLTMSGLSNGSRYETHKPTPVPFRNASLQLIEGLVGLWGRWNHARVLVFSAA